MALRSRTLVAAAVLGTALVAWVVTVQRMRGMDAGPGTDLGGFGWFVGIWVTMTAAMMLPSAAPAVVTFARFRRGARVVGFVAGYLVLWTAYGLAAYALYRLIRAQAPSFIDWHERGPWVAGGALVLAGVYQLTPLKRACLRRCRAPLGLIMGRRSSFGSGLEHGAACVGCCLGLMLALFALGVMSLFWMAVVATAIFIEKVLPAGERIAAAFAAGLVALGIWVAAAPASVPELTQPPSGHDTMPMPMR
jgi:predicted metal-binding membrane protein